jgi:hypothetical protein
MQNLLKIALPDEALYREIMLSLGYPKNKVNFLELALMTPYSEIRKLKEKLVIEKALLYRAGFIDDKDGLPENFGLSLRMDKSVWIYRGIRPANFPEKRIKGIVELLANSTKGGLINLFLEQINNQMGNKSPKSALKMIMSFNGIGQQRKEEMFFNVILPFFMVFSKDDNIHKFLEYIFKSYPPLKDNKFIRSFRNQYSDLKIETAKEYMGALFFKKQSQEARL